MNKKKFNHKRHWCSTGFSLIETMVVVAIIAILAAMTAPVFVDILSKHQVRYVARAVASTAQQARMQAANTQKPIRMVVNCSDFNIIAQAPCVAFLESAIYINGAVTGWTEISFSRKALDSQVNIVGNPNNGNGTATPDRVFWAIFMPSGKVFSSPRPFELYVAYYTALGAGNSETQYETILDEYENGNHNIWGVDVNNTSGRTLVNRGK